MKKELEITEEEIAFLKQLKIYFGEHDKIMFEHKAYPMLDNLVKKLHLHSVSKSVDVEREPAVCLHDGIDDYRNDGEGNTWCVSCGHEF